MKTDESFRARVLGAADAAARLALVRAGGFDVTAEELADYAARLDDAELSAAVGAGVGAAPSAHVVGGAIDRDGPAPQVVVC